MYDLRSSRPRRRGGPVLAVLAVLVLVGAAQPVLACTAPPPVPPPVWIVFHTRTNVWIIFHHYRTVRASFGQFCACGLKQVGPIESINGVHVADANGRLIPGFSFTSNPVTGEGFAAFDPTGDASWSGFLSAIDGEIPDGEDAALMFDVTVPAGTTFNDLAAALADQGLVGTDEGTPDGGLSGNHLSIVRPGVIMESSNAEVRASIGQIMRERSRKH